MIRWATLDDIEEMSKVHATTWKSAYKGILSQKFLQTLSDTYWVNGFRKGMEGQKRFFAVAVENHEIVGVIGFGKNRWDFVETVAEIYSLYVLPSHQNKQYGKKLIDFAIEALTEKGYTKVMLNVVDKNTPARLFYEKMSFVNTQQIMTSEIAGARFNCLVYERFM
ncbi:GNAT family N-acetyltransferase [Carnobacteriaceae bacterium zg-ZUI78]|nr:GNAT family N-acetyltransferase [Carnobacteriaceae bacterium zg-ZUI78]